MAEYLTPGVYVEEFDSGESSIASVSTSTAGFIGVTEKGPQKGSPVLVTSASQFRRIFGGFLPETEFGEYRFLPYAVNQFFMNGGARCYIKRVVPSDAKYARNVENVKEAPLVLFAKDPGAWGNKITVTVTPAAKAKTQILEEVPTSNSMRYRVKNANDFIAGDVVCVDRPDGKLYNKVSIVDGKYLEFTEPFESDVTDTSLVPKTTISTCEVNFEIKYEEIIERFDNCSFNVTSPNFIQQKLARSELVLVEAKVADELITPFKLISGLPEGEFLINLYGGANGTKDELSASDYIGEDKGPGNRSGIQAFIDNNEVSVMAVPGITDPNVALTLVAHCENAASRFAVLDVPVERKTVNEVLEYRSFFDSDYAALYHPWVKVFDPLTKNSLSIPPSGSVCGIYARSDNTRGVHKAPANEIVSACVGLEYQYTNGEQDILNPKGVNLIRSFPGAGIRVWGARTASSNPLWRYINVRRLFIFIEESIKANTNWVVFEPNDQILWLRVRRTIEIFLGGIWRSGGLMGSTEDEAFFVDIGQSTMTQDDIDNGRLICVIGVAPVKPAEFVIFRITQKTSGSAE